MSAPFPECLAYLLKEAVLKRAKRDTLSETLREMMADPEVKSVLKANERPLRRSFTDKWRADKDGSKQSRDVQMAMSTFIEHLSELRNALVLSFSGACSSRTYVCVNSIYRTVQLPLGKL